MRNQKGQALIIVLLAMSVVLTTVLYILSRSITDIAVSSNESQAVSAFSAAEAGVEQALVIGSGNTSNVGNASYTSNVTNVAQNVTSFIYPVELSAGDVMTLWLKSQDSSPDFTGSTVKICWGNPTTSASVATTPAIEATVFYETAAGNPATTQIYRAAFDPYQTRAQTPVNAFSPSAGVCTINGQNFAFSGVLSGLNTLGSLQFISIRMYYNTDTSQPIAFDSTTASTFPTQGITVDSIGQAGTSSRKVQVFEGWPEVPGVFMNAIYSSTGLTK